MRAARLIVAAALASVALAAGAYCEPVHDPNAPPGTYKTARLFAPGTETFAKAYAALAPSGGVIEVPHGEHTCTTWWAAARTSVPYSVTVRGIAGPAGEKPVFRCDKGTFMSVGPPFYEPDGVTPSATRMVSVVLDNLRIDGYTRWITGFNLHEIAFHRVNATGMWNGNVVTGKGFVQSERVGPNQRVTSEICDSTVGYAGGGNQDHPVYTHGGPGTHNGTFYFVHSKCEASRDSHCVKTTAAEEVIIEDSQLLNECLPGQPCGTEVLNMVAGVKRGIVRRNTLARGNDAAPGQRILGASVMSTSGRKFFFDGPTVPIYDAWGVLVPFVGNTQGGLFAPLYEPTYLSAEFHSDAFWAAAAAAGDVPENPFLRKVIVHNNVFTNHGAPAAAMLLASLYPMTSDGSIITDCMVLLRTPDTHVPLERTAIFNNRFEGNWTASGDIAAHIRRVSPLELRKPNTCGKPMHPKVQWPVVWDLGGNSAGSAPIPVPAWAQ